MVCELKLSPHATQCTYNIKNKIAVKTRYLRWKRGHSRCSPPLTLSIFIMETIWKSMHCNSQLYINMHADDQYPKWLGLILQENIWICTKWTFNYKTILIIPQNISGFDGSNCSLGRNQDQHKVCAYSGTHFAGWKLSELRLQECTVFGIWHQFP